MIVSPSGSPCTCIKTGFNCSLPPVSHHLSFCFLPRDVEWKADENNLHAGERKRERETRKEGKTAQQNFEMGGDDASQRQDA